MKALHRAALSRAYRTLAQGFGGTAVITAGVALLGGGTEAKTAFLIALGTIAFTAIGSFWQGVAAGLPEVEATADET